MFCITGRLPIPFQLPRIYPILDSGTLARRGCDATMAAEAMIEAGARILQFRHKGHFSRAVFEQAARIAGLCRVAGAQFIVNDHADIALVLDAGLHVGQDDLPPASARALIGPSRLLGFSTHNAGQLSQATAEPADYLAIGPIFETGSKPDTAPLVGLAELERITRAARGCDAAGTAPPDLKPLAAIGGITLGNARQVFAAGADSVAVIHGMLPEILTPQNIRTRMTAWLQLATG
ncbi:MAG: thiamine phosphate synthase [Bryobacteraceae bacterium]|jgi:thiamine-phosphate pyrophosphorylase